MIASFGMYDMPHASAAYDRLWQSIRDELGTGPEKLNRTSDLWAQWHSPDLVVSQTCGLPYRARLYSEVTLVGTPDYGLRDCPPGYYYSYLIRRRGDGRSLRDLARFGTIAFNDPLSQSGWAAPVAHLAQHGLRPVETMETGAHIASARAVQQGHADYTAIDVITYQMWNHADPEVFHGLEAFLRTEPTPALPLITARRRDPKPIARAVTNAIGGMSDADRDILHLRGLIQTDVDTYRALPIPPLP